jgi:ribosomal protein S13
MNRCPHCRNTNLSDTEYRNITRCDDCGTEFRGETVFKEGTYRVFMNGVMTKLAGVLEARAATVVNEMRLNMLNNKEDVDIIVEKLMEITENINTANVIGGDRKEDVIQMVESIEKIVNYAHAMAERHEIDARVVYRLKLMEGIEDMPGIMPGLEGEPEAGPIITSDPAVGPSGFEDTGVAPGLEVPPPGVTEPGLPVDPTQAAQLPPTEPEPTPWQEGMWLGEKVKFCVEQRGEDTVYKVCKENGDPMISYNEETKSQEGLENFTEEQLEQLDNVIAEYSMGAGVEQQPAANAEGPVVSTSPEDPAMAAENISANAFADTSAGSSDLSQYKESPIYRQVEKNLKAQMKRGTFDEANARSAFLRVAKQCAKEGCGMQEGNTDVQSVAQSLLDEFTQGVNGPIGSPAATTDPAVDGPIGQPVVDEVDVNGPIGSPAAQAAPAVDGPVGQPIVGENELGVPGTDGEVELAPEAGAEGAVDQEQEIEQTPEEKEAAEEAEEEAAEHEEAEEKAIEGVQSAAEKAEDKIETAEKALEDLKAAVEALTDVEKEAPASEEPEACEGEDCEVEDGFEAEDGEAGEPVEPTEPTEPTEPAEADDDMGEIEDEEPAQEKLQEFEEKKVGKHKFVAKPEIIPAKREATGEKPDGHIVKYVKTVHDPSKEPAEQWSEEEAKIPLTQEEAEKAEVDEEGKKKKTAGDKNKKDEYETKDFKKGRPNLKEATRFNGFRLGDKIKLPGYQKSFDLTKITLEPVRFVLTEGKLTVTIDPNTDKFDLDADKDLKWQRTSAILEDTRAVWEEMEKSMVTEGCAGGVCTIGGPMHVTNNTAGIGNVSSMVSSFIATPICSISRKASDKDVYSYIKMNNLHTTPRQTAISHLLGNFQNTESSIEKIYDDAVMSLKYDDSNPESINEVDQSYGFKTQCTRGVDVQQRLAEGYEELKKLGIV